MTRYIYISIRNYLVQEYLDYFVYCRLIFSLKRMIVVEEATQLASCRSSHCTSVLLRTIPTNLSSREFSFTDWQLEINYI